MLDGEVGVVGFVVGFAVRNLSVFGLVDLFRRGDFYPDGGMYSSAGACSVI